MSPEIPKGIKIISIMYYAGAVVSLLFGIFMLIGAGTMSTIIAKVPLLALMGASMFVILGIFMIVVGLITFFLARGLWKLKQWARVVTIILLIISILLAIFSIATTGVLGGISNLVFNLVVVGSLLFSSKVKSAFSGEETEEPIEY